MKAFQAVYGEGASLGHELLYHSAADEEIRTTFIAASLRTGLSGDPPPETEWSPYFRGIVEPPYYVLAYTVLDVRATRGGMVRTHAVFTDLDEFAASADLRVSMDELRRLASAYEAGNPLPAVDLPSLARTQQYPPTDRYWALVDALVTEPVRLPIVWEGQGGFDEVICTLWEHLSPDLRKSMSFRISFGPRDVEDVAPTVVCTPQSIASHWPSQYRLIRIGALPPAQMPPAAAYFIGGGEGDELRQLQETLQLRVSTFRTLGDLALIDRLLKEVDAGGGFDPTYAALRVIAKAVPEPTKASDVKRRLLDRLVASAAVLTRQQVRSLRNFPSYALASASSAVETIVDDWLKATIRVPQSYPVNDVVSVVEEGVSGSSRWCLAIRAALQTQVVRLSAATGTALWTWWVAAPTLVPALFPMISNDPAAEKVIAAACPKQVKEQVGEAVAEAALARDWTLLHACALGASLSIDSALERQLAIDQNQDRSEGLSHLYHGASDTDLLSATLRLSDPRLVHELSIRMVSKPDLKSGLLPKNPTWRSIWLGSINQGSPPFSGVEDPVKAMHALLDAAIDDQGLSQELLSEIARRSSEHADITSFERRPLMWAKLPHEAKPTYLRATAAGWLRDFRTTYADSVVPEHELKAELLKWPRQHLPDFDLRADATLQLIHLFPEYQNLEGVVGDWVTNHPKVSSHDASAIGKFAASRGWRTLAQSLLSASRSGFGWEAAVEECEYLLKLHQRVIRTLSRSKKVDAANWWGAWAELAAELYPHGVEDRHIWDKSNGEVSAINTSQDGHSQWYEALSVLRQGTSGVTVEGLLHQMRQDFEKNPVLEAIEQAWLQDRIK